MSDNAIPNIRFGVMGTGRIIRRIVPDMQSVDSVDVTAIASRTNERARWAADTHGVALAIEGYEELLRRDDIDAVYIALPPSLHHEWTLRAARAGKHVLCEKPLALNAEQASKMVSVCNQEGVRLLDATAWLHHDRTLQLRSWLATANDTSGAATNTDPLEAFDARNQSMPDKQDWPFRLGPLRHVSASVSFCNPFQSGDHRLDAELGGGCLLDLGWYAAGAIAFATNGLPDNISAHIIHRDGVPDRVSATMLFPGNITATLSCGFDTATRKWLEFAGSEASIVCDDFTRPWPEKPARSWIHEASGQVHAYVPTSDQNDSRCHQERQMIATFVDWIQRPEADEPKPWQFFHDQALRTQSIIDQIAICGA